MVLYFQPKSDDSVIQSSPLSEVLLEGSDIRKVSKWTEDSTDSVTVLT